ENIAAVLAQAGASPRHIVRLTWYVRDMDEYLADLPALGAAYREVMGRHFPAMAVVEVSRLVEPEARLAIPATARPPRAAPPLSLRAMSAQHVRQPSRDRRNHDDDDEQHEAHRNIGQHRAKNVGHRDFLGRDALHRHQQKSMRRQQQAELHADQVENAEPDEIDAEALHDRHEHRQGDEHHADLVDKNAEKAQHQHHAAHDSKGGELATENV